MVYEPIRAIPRHQSCPKTGSKTSRLGITLMSFLVVLPPYFFLNIKLPFWDIDGATPTHSPKSGCKCPHRSRTSPISPDIHQPTLTKICHIDQSYPKTGGKTARKNIRVVPGQEAKPPGKTSELSFLGHRWRNFRHFANKGRDALNPILTGELRNRFLTAKPVPQVTC